MLGRERAEGGTVDVADPMSSPQFRLLVACAGWPRGSDRDEAVRRAWEDAGPDRAAFLAMVSRHRMASLALDGLTCAGIEPPPPLRASARKDVFRAMALSAEAARLQACFASEGIGMAVVKGPVLSQLLYGSPGLRHAKDLDIWVPSTDLARAAHVLMGCGYEMFQGPPSFAEPWLGLWLETQKDCEFSHPQTRLVVELHYRLNQNPHVMAGLEVADASRRVKLGGTVLTTLEDGDLFAYLCTHGAVSRWFRLKWLADIQAMLAVRTPVGIGQLFDEACTRDAERAAGLAIQLCRRLWNLEVPADLALRLDADRRLAWLERQCLGTLSGPEVAEGRFSAVPPHVFLWRLKDSWTYRARLLRHGMVDWKLMRRLPLPVPLHFLYPLLRPVSWLLRRLLYAAPQRS